MNKNPFTKKSVDLNKFANLVYDQTLTLTPADAPYYSFRSFRDKWQENPLSGEGFENRIDSIVEQGWARIELDATDQDEFDFLTSLGLTAEGTHISKLAQIFYNVHVGIFDNYSSDLPGKTRKQILLPFMQLMTTFVLPGRWWRAHYARIYLPDTIGHATRLDDEMLEIEDAWWSIVEDYDFPVLEDA